MQNSSTQTKAQDKFSLGAMLVTIIIANAGVLLYIAPYA
jgi:hypothetical protein